ncbi:MAG: hypothetical protein ACRCX2_01160 [Paraclostridium sp.]
MANVLSSSVVKSITYYTGENRNHRDRFRVKVEANTVKAASSFYIYSLPRSVKLYEFSLLKSTIVAAGVQIGFMSRTSGTVWLPTFFKPVDLSAATTVGSPVNLLVADTTFPTSIPADALLYSYIREVVYALKADSTYKGFYNSAAKNKTDVALDSFILENEYGLCITVPTQVDTEIEMIFDIQFSGL